MEQPLSSVIARYHFKPEHAEEFLPEGQLVTEVSELGIDEATNYIQEYLYALEDAHILVDGKNVVTLSDFIEDCQS